MNHTDDLIFQALMEEFKSLRAEVLERLKIRHQQMSVSLAIAGATLSFALSGSLGQSESQRSLALYIVAPITSAMGGLWVTNSWSIYRIHYYIIEVLAARANAMLQTNSQTGVFGWETSLQRSSKVILVSWMERVFFCVSFILPGVISQLLLLEGHGDPVAGLSALRFPLLYAGNWLSILGVFVVALIHRIAHRRREPPRKLVSLL